MYTLSSAWQHQLPNPLAGSTALVKVGARSGTGSTYTSAEIQSAFGRVSLEVDETRRLLRGENEGVVYAEPRKK